MAEPLVPKGPFTTGAVTISAASLVAALGWMGQKLLSIDEQVIVHDRLLSQLVAEDGVILHERIKGLEVSVSRLGSEQLVLRELLRLARESNK